MARLSLNLASTVGISLAWYGDYNIRAAGAIETTSLRCILHLGVSPSLTWQPTLYNAVIFLSAPAHVITR